MKKDFLKKYCKFKAFLVANYTYLSGYDFNIGPCLSKEYNKDTRRKEYWLEFKNNPNIQIVIYELEEVELSSIKDKAQYVFELWASNKLVSSSKELIDKKQNANLKEMIIKSNNGIFMDLTFDNKWKLFSLILETTSEAQRNEGKQRESIDEINKFVEDALNFEVANETKN